ncbi:uncharacterized protein [Anabrus simplex]|uniref:uncharacterized protein n=1 Tax=Anabrus simplex TaxID=316456 RepID=UPI0034DDBC9F
MPLNLQTLKKPTFVLKLVELVLAVIAIALVADSFIGIGGKLSTIYGTYIGFLILSCVMVAALFMETSPHPMLMLVVSAVAGIMFIVAGALCFDLYGTFEHFPNTTGVLVAGIIGIIGGIVYALDAFLTFKYNVS